MSSAKPPRAFISHTWDDKARFVLPFAAALRAKGIDAWVDAWEIRPGDSLVRKVFDEGIGKADAAIFVLSALSVTREWVREELSASFVAKIERQMRLIPLLIESCEIPMPLKHLAYVRVPDINSFDTAVDQITSTLFGEMVRPELGQAPSYTRRPTSLNIPGLERSDIEVLLAIGRIYLDRGERMIDRGEIDCAALGFSEALLLDSLEILDDAGFVRGTHAVGGKYFLIELTVRGAEVIVEALVSNADEIERQIVAYLVNNDQCDSGAVVNQLRLPQSLVDHTIRKLSSRGLISIREYVGGILVYEVSARLRRALSR